MLNSFSPMLLPCYSHCNLFDQLPFPLSGLQEYHVDHLRLAHLVQGHQQLHCAGLLLPALKAQVCRVQVVIA